MVGREQPYTSYSPSQRVLIAVGLYASGCEGVLMFSIQMSASMSVSRHSICSAQVCVLELSTTVEFQVQSNNS